MKTMLFNPYSGKPRHPLDIASDPEGILMIDPDEPLFAAALASQNTPPPAAPVASHEPVPYGKLFTMLRWSRQFVADDRLYESELDPRRRSETNQEHADRISFAMQANEDLRNFLREIDEVLALIDAQPDIAPIPPSPPPESAGQRLSDAEIDAIDLRAITAESGTDWLRALVRKVERLVLAANPTAQPDGGSKA